MINATLARRFGATVLAILPSLPALTAQQVHLSEVRADALETWIELHNRGTSAVDISTWSLHAATHTPGMPGSYWWPMPAGCVIQPGGFLRVHWFQVAPAQSATTPEDLYTGTSPYGFLFGLGGESLPGDAGAVALFRSQANGQMNDPANVEDWVSYGTGGFEREPLAVTAGLWTAGRVAPTIPAGSSLARNAAAIGATQFADQTWFIDSTPTPLLPNITGAVVESYGDSCTLPGHHLLGTPDMHASSIPLLGNQDFALTIDNTTGIYGEYVLIAFGAAAGAAGQPSILPPYAGIGCHEAIDTGQLVLTWLWPAQVLATTVPLPLDGYPPAIVGTELHAQALVLDLLSIGNPPYQGLSNALRVVVGQ